MLSYLSASSFAKRIGEADRMIKEKRTTDYIFSTNFNSAEGWYSEAVLVRSKLSVSIVGRGFDDFNSDPVIYSHGNLYRCKEKDLIRKINEVKYFTEYHTVTNDLPVAEVNMHNTL